MIFSKFMTHLAWNHFVALHVFEWLFSSLFSVTNFNTFSLSVSLFYTPTVLSSTHSLSLSLSHIHILPLTHLHFPFFSLALPLFSLSLSLSLHHISLSLTPLFLFLPASTSPLFPFFSSGGIHRPLHSLRPSTSLSSHPFKQEDILGDLVSLTGQVE